MRVKGSTAVTVPSRTDHRERKALETRLARGIVREPKIGTKTVRRVMVSIFMRLIIYWTNPRKVKNFLQTCSQAFLIFFTGISTGILLA